MKTKAQNNVRCKENYLQRSDAKLVKIKVAMTAGQEICRRFFNLIGYGYQIVRQYDITCKNFEVVKNLKSQAETFDGQSYLRNNKII